MLCMPMTSPSSTLHVKMVQQSRPRPYTTTSGKGVSPPPLKRRKLTQTPGQALDSTRASSTLQRPNHGRNSFRVFSWNINGIRAFLSSARSNNKKITSYFARSTKTQNASNTDEPPGTSRIRTVPNDEDLNGSPYSLRAFLSRNGWPEVLFLQELKLSSPALLPELLSALNTPLNNADDVSDDRTYTLDTSLARDKHNVKAWGGNLYGVGTIIRTDFARKWVDTVREVDWDIEGRVMVVEMRGTPEGQDGNKISTKPLALINVYAVNGTSKPYRSPKTGEIDPNCPTRHDRKLAFHTLLRDECLSLEKRGFCVIIAGDVNIARGPIDGHPNLRTVPQQHCLNRADFNTKFFGEEDNKRAGAYVGPWKEDEKSKDKSLDAVDVFRAKYGMEKRYTYYPHCPSSWDWGTSCDRVDMVVVSKQLWEDGRVIDTGIMNTPQDRDPSDHVPLWVEVAL
ncbi:Endonuclease/exonuclease/phosphatase [Sordaria brevicollis]|uniref:Endonuclease/exonuclease/phosphatase n=1 Tax=Sordaria brevicollis TaxID=83679 RepID=A0AAE0UDZ1_SORBR|nr:Endonuclease/exonuclease/phosphatase [Sordaria brevicollis]